MPFRYINLLLLVAVLAGCEQPETESAQVPEPEPVEPPGPVYKPWGVDLDARDLDTNPGNDFHRYVNGNWLDNNEIPPERSSWGVGLLIHERAQERVRTIIEELASQSGAKGTPEQKVGDYYASWMDTASVNGKGIAPLQPDLDRIAAIEDADGLASEFGKHYYISGTSPFSAGLGINPRNPDEYNINVGLTGLGLPDRDYYLEDSERLQKIRDEYLVHIAQMLDFAGYENSAEKAQVIFDLEKKIAELQWIRADRRDRDKTYNPIKVADLKTSHPDFNWDTFLASHNLAFLEEVNLLHPNTIEPLILLVNNESIATWKDYLSYHLISNNAATLSQEIDDANFEFWGKIVNGQQEQLARWKRGVARVGAKTGLGEALGQIYVKRHFDESAKAQMIDLVENLRAAYKERIEDLEWMGEETKQEALHKLAAFRAKIGYPDTWMDLSDISIDKGDLFGNTRRIRKFFEDFDVARLKRPTDRDEWFMMPQTVNAYYLPNFNEIVFPAAILEAPYFDPDADPAVNYGSIGAIIGHEMGHGFDDQGSKSDAQGIKRNWWTEEDRSNFDARTSKLAEQYNSYEAVPGHFVDGEFTLGENIGDLGGVEVAYHAYRLSLDGTPAPVIDGITGDQRFFLSFGQSWRTKRREDLQLQLLKSDPHSPAKFRVNGVVRNVDAWYDAFDVKETDALYLPPEDRVSIW